MRVWLLLATNLTPIRRSRIGFFFFFFPKWPRTRIQTERTLFSSASRTQRQCSVSVTFTHVPPFLLLINSWHGGKSNNHCIMYTYNPFPDVIYAWKRCSNSQWALRLAVQWWIIILKIKYNYEDTIYNVFLPYKIWIE